MKAKCFFSGSFIKGIALFISLMPIVGMYAQSTMVVNSSSCATSSNNMTVRISSGGTEIISSHYENSIGEFIKFGQTLPGRYIKMSWDKIKDFTVLNGVIYFCGSIGTKGFLGWFNESDFSLNQFYAKIVYLQNEESADKIKAYVDDLTQEVIIVVLGKKYNDPVTDLSVHKNHLLVGHFDGADYNYVDYEITTGNFPYNNNRDYFQDVVLTDDYIVAVGIKSQQSQEFQLSRIKKGNIGMMEQYTVTDPAPNALNSPCVLERLQGNDVAFASYYFDVNGGNYYMRIYTFDMDNFTNTGVQDVKLPSKTVPDDMQYLPYDNSLLLLLSVWDYPSPNDQSSIVYYLDPYATASYTADFMYDNTYRLRSIDKMPGSHFLLGGKNANNERLYIVRDKMAGTTSNCVHYSHTSVTVKSVLTGSLVVTFGSNLNVPVVDVQYDPTNIMLYDICQ